LSDPERNAVRDSASPGALVDPLGHRERRVWPADPSAYGPRRVTRGGAYEVFIPARIADRTFPLGDAASAAIAQATKALGQLSAMTPRLASLDALARNVLRSESMASSRIEGVTISHKRLAGAAYAKEHSRRGDGRAAEVLGNVEAMQLAIDIGARNEPFTVDDVKGLHRTLLRYVDDEDIAGVIRDKQNWIGGNDYNPVGAAFVPPPPEHLEALLDDLCRFIARDDLAAVTQAAAAHANSRTSTRLPTATDELGARSSTPSSVDVARSRRSYRLSASCWRASRRRTSAGLARTARARSTSGASEWRSRQRGHVRQLSGWRS
jgi:hypothetical protein